MGNTYACIRHLKEEEGLLDAKIGETEAAPPATERATSSSSQRLFARIEGTVEKSADNGGDARIAQQIERSKWHWSQLSECGSDFNEEEVAADNREVFQTLQLHPTWGHFFSTFGYDTDVWLSMGSMEVREKFAEGGQAELFHVKVTWKRPEKAEEDREKGTQWVLKVFKKGSLLRHLQSQWPHGMLQFRAEMVEHFKLGKSAPVKYICEVFRGILLEDGRFAFLMRKEPEDLRSLIDRKMLKWGKCCGPFSKEKSEEIMYRIALGMNWLHNHNIVHRDLKASNVLVKKFCGIGDYYCFVADFECSIGVVGTGFWRAPEILQACKDGVENNRQELYTMAIDVYSYGMTCYEILTGKSPLEHHSQSENRKLIDLVINGLRPKIPKFVDVWIHDLLRKCWQFNPVGRPSFGEILSIFEANSNSAIIEELCDEIRRKK